ncbi:hypothetical protein D3C87_1933030 [compost metagenome]
MQRAMYGHNRHRGGPDDLFGMRTDEEFFEPRSTVSAHDDQVDLLCCDHITNDIVDVSGFQQQLYRA